MLPYTALNPVDVSYSAFLASDEWARERAIRRARAFSSGRQFVYLTDRLRSFLQDPLARGSIHEGGRDATPYSSITFSDADILRLNVCHTIVKAVTERLIVSGFSSGNTALQTWAADIWQRNRLDARADDVHEATVRDGESFVLVSWDSTNGMPRMTPHPRFVEVLNVRDSLLLDGDGYGIRAFYQDDDDQMPMLYAVKRWYEVTYEDGKRTTRQRATFYYPDRVEKYVVLGGGLERVTDDGDTEWPLPWVDAQGMPLGIPVVHFKNPGLNAEAWEAIPMQNAINKTLVDLLASSDFSAFRLLVALGFNPVDGDGNPLVVEPGSWVGTTNKDGKVQVVEGANLDNIINLLDSLITKAAMVTDTPTSRFVMTKSIAAEGTLKQQEAPLLGKIRRRQMLLGNAWEDCLYVARRLWNTFGDGGLDETALLSTEWESAEMRDEDALIARLQIKAQALGVPQQQLWREMGYDDAQIEQFTALKAEAQQQAIQQQIRSAQARAPQGATGAMPQQIGVASNEGN